MSDVEFEIADRNIRIGDREFADSDIIISDEMFAKARAGYLCIKCWGPQEVAFPKKCREPFCQYPMKDRQSMDIMSMYAGVSKTPDWAYDQNELDERAKEHYQRKGIWLPPDRRS